MPHSLHISWSGVHVQLHVRVERWSICTGDINGGAAYGLKGIRKFEAVTGSGGRGIYSLHVSLAETQTFDEPAAPLTERPWRTSNKCVHRHRPSTVEEGSVLSRGSRPGFR